jgi:epoxyqueuosine reductase
VNESHDRRADAIKTLARELGFDVVGIAAAHAADGFERFQEWLNRGFAGEMAYMSQHADARRDPRSILPQVRSVVMLGLNYKPARLPARTGKVARYALGADYHDVLREKLNALLARIQLEHPGVQGRGVVDTAPLLERDFARRAGLGWIGKNTMLIHKRLGSYLFLGALLLDLELRADAPFDAFHCGTCTRCLDACPTGAFEGPGWLDARRCISYLTIELRSSVPAELRPGLGDWLFGCDVCQEVCPWNRKAPDSVEPAFAPRPEYEALDILELARLSETDFRRLFRGTALMRSKRRGFVRNVLLVLGNVGDASALPVLDELERDPEPLVREAAAWARTRIGQRLHLDSSAAGEQPVP